MRLVKSHSNFQDMKIAFLTLGCKLNYAETSTYERGFVAAGLEVVQWEDKADVYLVNTCSVTERAEKKCRNVIRKVHRVSPEARIVVTGCYAQLRREELEAIEGVALVFGAADKTRVVPDTLALLGVGSRREVLSPAGERPFGSAQGPVGERSRTTVGERSRTTRARPPS